MRALAPFGPDLTALEVAVALLPATILAVTGALDSPTSAGPPGLESGRL